MWSRSHRGQTCSFDSFRSVASQKTHGLRVCLSATPPNEPEPIQRAAEPTGRAGEPTCQAEVISNSVQAGTGRRAVAEFFFGDYPTAVQDAERAVQEVCASQ